MLTQCRNRRASLAYGAFLVRDSSVPHALALSYVQEDQTVTHIVLEHWDCENHRRGWSREGGRTTCATVEGVLSYLAAVKFP